MPLQESDRAMGPVRVPKLGLHKASGQARVVVEGKSFYLGRPGAEATARYQAFVAAFLRDGKPPATSREVRPSKFVVADLAASFLEKHTDYYVGPTGKQTGELANYVDAIRVLLAVAPTLPAAEFSPRWFHRLQDAMVAKGWSRKRINDQVRRVKRIFKWAVGQELVPPEVYQGARAIEGLKRFRSAAPESPGVRPVDEDVLAAAMPHLPEMIRAMVQVQLLTGMRVGELVRMRGEHIDRSSAVWIYKPPHHKTVHVGRERVIAIGPEAQKELGPWLLRAGNGSIFSPRENEKLRAQSMRAARQSKVTPSQDLRASHSRARASRRSRPPGEHYTPSTYRRAIERACRAASVEAFVPSQLRHNAADRFRRHFGVEVARCVLGHADVRTTELYSSFDAAKAADAAERLG